MTLHEVALGLLLTLSGLLGVKDVKLGPNAALWETKGRWVREGEYLTFTATSEKIPELCRENSESVVEFPEVIQGAHEFHLDGHLVAQYGDRSFRTVEKFYGKPVINCRLLRSGRSLTWKVSSFADYFARISALPTVTRHASFFNFFAETLHTVAAGAMMIMAIYTFFLFYGPVSSALTLSIVASCVLMSFYFLSCASDDFGLTLDMLDMHKFADVSLWFGILMLFNAYRLEGMMGKTELAIYAAAGFVGTMTILLGQNGDEVQLGTTIPCVTGFLNLFSVTLRSQLFDRTWSSDRQSILQLLSLFAFLGGLMYEMSVIVGLLELPPLLPMTQTGGVLFMIFSVNQRITTTYRERDHLRANLEAEVERKTSELKTALSDLRSTQAELVQSAKLASLGTLSAGIAHEINNSLNFVNGALRPLQKLIQASGELSNKDKIEKLFGAMNEGMKLSLEIVASLRNYTGLNQAKYNDLKVKTVVQSVLTILRRKLADRIEVKIDVDEDLTVFGSVVGLNQVLMNLITNSVDAMPEGGTLSVRAASLGDDVELSIGDTGVGIPESVVQRIFDPFFTTKDVGKGTGLGLHIVKNEIEKHRGKIELKSEVGVGTTFILTLPKTEQRDVVETMEKRAA